MTSGSAIDVSRLDAAPSLAGAIAPAALRLQRCDEVFDREATVCVEPLPLGGGQRGEPSAYRGEIDVRPCPGRSRLAQSREETFVARFVAARERARERGAQPAPA